MNELREIKFFGNPDGSAFLNADDAPFSLGENQWLNAENCRTGSTDKGVINTVESIGSTLLLSQPQPSVSFIEIGTCSDEVGGRLFRFLFNSTGTNHKITAIIDGVEYNVLLSSQVTSGLNFSKDYPIHSSNVVNGLLYWTDNLNNQRKINIDAALKMNNPSYITDQVAYVAPLSETSITVIRRPPQSPLYVSKSYQSSPVVVNNYVKNFSGQFSYRFYYRDGETSVPSVYSILVPYNSSQEAYNRVDIAVPVSEYIEQDVQRVDILVKYGNENTFYLIKSWDKNIPSEAQEIANHNAGTTLLSYFFYNDTVGAALDEAYSLKPFDSVPILSKTQEIFRNRLGYGNNVEGYDTPTSSSLNATPVEQSQGGDTSGQWILVTWGGEAFPSTKYYLYILTEGYFESTVQPPPFPASVDYVTDLTFITDNIDVFAGYLQDMYGVYTMENTDQYPVVTNPPTPLNLTGQRCFKSGGSYNVAIVFYDFADRKCGVTGSAMISGVAVSQPSFNIPDRSYDNVSYVTQLRWTLSNSNAISEIPLWATRYSIVLTKCLSTTYFLQARSRNTSNSSSMTYVNRDANNDYTFATASYDSELVGVGIDITNLANFGMGYVFSQGDSVKIYIDGNPVVYNLSILAQDGRWIICELQDLGTLNGSTDALFEIYTPYIKSVNEPYYEIAQTYQILNAGTSIRAYSNLAGTIRGDVTLLERGTSPNEYITENMSPNDKFYQNWYTDFGASGGFDNILKKLGKG